MTKINQNVKKKPKKPKKGKVKKRTYPSVETIDLIDRATGELVEVTTITKNVYADTNFHKIWLEDLLSVLGFIGSKKLDVLNYLLSNMRNEDNTVSVSYRSIQKDTGIAYGTVASSMQIFMESNLIKKIGTGTYQFNPDIIVKGSGQKRDKLLIQYNIIDKEEEA